MKNNKMQERIGEKRRANNGMWMTIIAYRNCKDTDVQFEDGIIVYNKNYYSFLRGEIGHPHNNSVCKKERIGEKKMSNCGLEMEVVGYRNMDDLDVQFEDGTIMKNQKYKSFQEGQITPSHMSYKNRHIGEQVKSKLGIITLIQYRKYVDVDVQFEDGTIIRHVTYQNFQKGQVKKVQCKTKPHASLKKEREGEEVRALNGLMMKIKEYRTANDIDVEFEDGFIAYNKTYANFKKGRITHQTKRQEKCIKTRIGEEGYAHNGLLMKIVGYRNRNDIDIEFEDGVIVKNRKYRSFKSGGVKHPYISNIKSKTNREGKIGLARNGMKMKIKEYRTNDDVDIEFEDGTIVEHKTYQNFRIGNIAHPDISLSHISVPEATILYYLSQIGFEKKSQGYFSKFHPSFGRTEIDIFNENLMIGIEYDGFYFHHGKDNERRDDKKDRSSERAGIFLIRVRENGLLPTKNNNTINILRQCNQDYNEMENIIYQILYHISEKSKKQYDIDVNIARDYNEIINLASHTSNHLSETNNVYMKKRVGEKRVSNAGFKMTIIAYRKYDDIDIMFEDKTIVYNRRYNDFKKGQIKHPGKEKSRIGETKTANNGMKMTIVTYHNSRNVDIKFEDGIIVYKKSYKDFSKGAIGHPTVKTKHHKNKVESLAS